MRIISGTARGRKLREPSGLSIRPTSDMVKESIFNIVQFSVAGARVLDLFAGTGQLGLEALSRGAAEAVFVDENPEAVKLIRENVKTAGFGETAAVVTRDALTFLKEQGKYDLIFLDPPYETKLLDKTLEKIFEFDKLYENGIIICETKNERVLPLAVAPYMLLREYRYGGTKVGRYVKSGSPDLQEPGKDEI